MKRLVLVSVIAASMVTTASCARVKNASENVFGARQTYEGVRFRAKLDSDREDRAKFVVTVNDAGQSLSGAREAARHGVPVCRGPLDNVLGRFLIATEDLPDAALCASCADEASHQAGHSRPL